jgi:hypothetical protein
LKKDTTGGGKIQIQAKNPRDDKSYLVFRRMANNIPAMPESRNNGELIARQTPQ